MIATANRLQQQTAPDARQIAALLAAPFSPAEVRFKPGAVANGRALALPYIDARSVMDRLDEILGIDGWSDEYECQADGTVLCKLSVRIGAEWVTKSDVGGPSEQSDAGDRRKAAVSDALKRAAVHYGVGRYLYRAAPQWVEFDARTKKFTRTPLLPAPGKK